MAASQVLVPSIIQSSPYGTAVRCFDYEDRTAHSSSAGPAPHRGEPDGVLSRSFSATSVKEATNDVHHSIFRSTLQVNERASHCKSLAQLGLFR